ncbi:sterol desaturase family protein [Mycolicibacterium smegmatis]|uniref:Membrane-bound C-5 Sterol desaturase erg3 n=3 Tax=Mycobacteriaceae TaxID=1762 RepID=I7FKC6_MYCS2|nr:sterol desaturase family protein [Mycolicibacterium smegmatis]ABK73356.1 C-5 sterol desaturase [Mycolicibacterium smegmatis MC2 155]AFP39208.1 Membrane-bound C-5 Sterol desaturase erg3 [Mycolicibacterium smegmatis MC2 155]AIU07978.1 C-5 sterol desaturase [Mycolicibacterium smegmatis MC2 155]AIU14603.1 C-5 sterol desaturase [Mycolicibacterium smegmatis]AIU21226.1 C-5 sterol desaturase [Mycolicibacterium smegmatis]
MDITMTMLLWTAPAFVVLSIVEWLDERQDPQYAQKFSARDYAGNWATYALNAVFKFAGQYLLPFSTIVIASSLTPLRLSPRHWWVWVACLIATDFCYYWAHRADHRVRLLWTAHSVHHSSRFFNLSTNLRLPWFHPVSYTLRSLAWVPVALLGFPVWMIFVLNTAGLLFQIPCHTERIGTLWPAWEFMFNTPSHHRVHHGSNMSYIDKNYGGVFIVWDRLFGTYAAEVEPVRYGLIHDVGSQNPVKFNYLETVAMLRDVAHAKTWRARFGYVFGPPGWSEKAVPAPSLTT